MLNSPIALVSFQPIYIPQNTCGKFFSLLGYIIAYVFLKLKRFSKFRWVTHNGDLKHRWGI